MTRGDEGFSLVELLLAIVIGGIVMGTITSALILSLRVTEATDERTVATRDAQLLSLYFSTDVQSAKTVLTAEPACAEAAAAGIKQFLVGFTFSTGTISYYTFMDAASSELQLRRRRCTTTVTTTQVLARNLTGIPTRSCTGTCVANSRSVTLAVASTGFDFTLTGTRRAA